MSQTTDSVHAFPPHALEPDSDHQVIALLPRLAARAPADRPARSDRRAEPTPRAQFSARTIRQVAVLEVAGQLGDVAKDLDHALRLAIADQPRGVVLDLSSVLGAVEPAAVEVLATAGRYVRDWPGIPLAVVCPDRHLREALSAHLLGRHLIAADSLFCALTEVLATPALTARTLRLAPHPTAPHAARNFVIRILQQWQLSPIVPLATRVVSELVASSSVHAGTDIELSIVWDRGALRLAVTDQGPALAGQPHSDPDLYEPGLSVVGRLSRTCGFLPTANGGTQTWAVLDAPRSPTAGPAENERTEALISSRAQALAEQYSSPTIEQGIR